MENSKENSVINFDFCNENNDATKLLSFLKDMLKTGCKITRIEPFWVGGGNPSIWLEIPNEEAKQKLLKFDEEYENLVTNQVDL